MRQRGFTLLELMIATSVGVIVTGSVFFVMTNQTETNRQTQELIEAQQNVRRAMVSISSDINRAGFGMAAVPHPFLTRADRVIE